MPLTDPSFYASYILNSPQIRSILRALRKSAVKRHRLPVSRVLARNRYERNHIVDVRSLGNRQYPEVPRVPICTKTSGISINFESIGENNFSIEMNYRFRPQGR